MGKSRAVGAEVRMWVAERPAKDVMTAIERLARLPDAVRVAVMPDVHLGEKSCNGVVLATRTRVYPHAVGSDIGCGYSAVPVGEPCGTPERGVLMRVLVELRTAVPILRQRSLADAAPLPGELDVEGLSPELRTEATRLGRVELGTLGRGNHFLELQVDQEHRHWLMVHSGSRAMGQLITQRHEHRIGRDGLDASGEGGQAYLRDASWAERYARVSRRCMLAAAAEVVEKVVGWRAEWGAIMDSSHNHVRWEEHGGMRLLVHRKGASRAVNGEPGIIPGSMATESYHVVGRGEPESLNSSSHGAGRSMSRTEARRRIRVAHARALLGTVAVEYGSEEAMVEECSEAYKDIRAVMRAQRDLVRIRRRLRTVMCSKGG